MSLDVVTWVSPFVYYTA